MHCILLVTKRIRTMAIVEKKYLLNNSVNSLLNEKELTKKSISQFYTQIKICKEVRIEKLIIIFIKQFVRAKMSEKVK